MRHQGEGRSKEKREASEALTEFVRLQCPYCGEWQQVFVDPESQGEMVEDCEVCCQPWRLQVRHDPHGQPQVQVERL